MHKIRFTPGKYIVFGCKGKRSSRRLTPKDVQQVLSLYEIKAYKVARAHSLSSIIRNKP